MSVFIIPVIDLLDGQVVHARGGRRSDYQPVSSPLCASSEPSAVVSALLHLHPFSIIYAADLGAMLGREPHNATLTQLIAAFPGVTFWVDSGSTHPVGNQPGMRQVIGTETGISAAALALLTRSGADYVLSLDFNASGFMGDADILRQPECWPRQVIILHLASVGAARGPAWSVIDAVIGRAPHKDFYVAGGMRDAADLAQAAARGLKGALVATALHAGTLDPAQFPQAKKTPA